MSSFQRGFKSWAEKTSVAIRKDLNLQPHHPLNPFKLADNLGVKIWTPNEVDGIDQQVLNQLLRVDRDGWSAVSFMLGSKNIIIHNPTHKGGRTSSNIMHELAHILANHEPSNMIISVEGDMVMRSFNQKQEDEANWLGGCLLLPRQALLHVKRMKLSEDAIRKEYMVSNHLLQFRINVSGVKNQLSYFRK